MSDQAIAVLTRADFKSPGHLADAKLKDLKDLLRAHQNVLKLRSGNMSRAQAVTRVVSASIPARWDQILANTSGPMDKVDQVIHCIVFRVKTSTQPDAQDKEKPPKKNQSEDEESSLTEPDPDSDCPKSPGIVTSKLYGVSVGLTPKFSSVAGTSEDVAPDIKKLKVPAEAPADILPDAAKEGPKPVLAPIIVDDNSVITVLIIDNRVGAHPHDHKTIIGPQRAGFYLVVDLMGTVHIRTEAVVDLWTESQWFVRLGNDVFYVYGDIYIPGTVPDPKSKLQPIAFTYVDAAETEPAYLMQFYQDPPFTDLIAQWEDSTSTWLVQIQICVESDLPPGHLPLLTAERDEALSLREEKRRINAHKRGRSTSSTSPPSPPHIRDNPPKPKRKKSRKKMSSEEQSENKAHSKQKQRDQFDACVAHLAKTFGSDVVVNLISDPHQRKTKHMVATVKQWASKIFEIMETCKVTADGLEIRAVHVQKFTGRSPDWVKQALDVGKLLQNARICALPGVRTWLDTKYGDVGMKSYLVEFRKVVKKAEEVAAEEAEEGGEGLKAPA
ncbi:hypothetical protein B0H11DRAFT_1926160 [Mycena galericulata]|nr:hypothetical protein B0H11DRAFT_1926160 [Mycena galericulata]